ncbi:MAG TPA: MlaD family protein [Solirubrobacterales bacterium]|nr:MlaD family protein [Solirubrobacterales bacterium]
MIAVSSAFNNTRKLVVGAVAAAVVVVAIASMGAGDKADGYKIRALFKNSSQVAIGADVRVAGANVGIVKRIFVGRDNKASIVLGITDPAFQRFYSDAKCRVKLQSLIGERSIDCEPGTPTKPELPQDPTDPTRRLLSDDATASPVDVDQILNAMREPERERFRIIMGELGVTLAGRGQDLNEVIKNFSPTFKEIDDILKILARQNKNLERLAVDGDQVLQEFAANKEHISGLFKNADLVQRGVNVRRQELAETLARLPKFLDELEPTATELKRLSTEAAPIAKAARESGKDLSTFVSNTADFATEANKGFKKLAESTDVFREQIPVLLPLATDLNAFASNRKSVTNISKLLNSFQKQGGYANLASLTFGIVGASNGFDAFGHFLRSGIVVNGACLRYSNTYGTDCSASFAQNRTEPNQEPGTVATEASASTSRSAGASSKSPASSTETAALDYLLGGER